MTSETVSITLDNAGNALALNKQNTQVAIAGRSILKIFNLIDDSFDEILNLRVGKNLNLNFAHNDVVWNHTYNHTLATAATNGAVVLWNLNKSTLSKQEHVFTDHERTVNKVNFHMAEPHLLLSGSQDGTMKCFDLRMKQVVKTFRSNTDSVRDVQFSPHQSNTFCAVSENGYVQLWDLRRPDRYVQNYAAHSGPIFTCDWHPEVNWLATASRDKTIKVWDLSVRAACETTINTMASVGKIQWRPQHKFQIASTALVIDFDISVWDLRRPYVAFARFNEQKDAPTGFVWRGCSDLLVSISRDAKVILHSFRDAIDAASKMNPQGLAMDLKGDVMSAMDIKTAVLPNSENTPKSTGKIKPIDCSGPAASVLCEHSNAYREQFSFEYFARNYIITGDLRTICDKNAEVAKNFGHNTIENMWRILKMIYVPPTAAEVRAMAMEIASLHMSQQNSGTTTEQNNTGCNNDVQSLPGAGPSAARGGNDETKTDETPGNHNYLSNIASGSGTSVNNYRRPPLGDFTFGDEDEDQPMPMELRPEYKHKMFSHEDDLILPVESIELRHDLEDRCPSPTQVPSNSQVKNDGSGSGITEEAPQLTVANITIPTLWDPSDIVKRAMFDHIYGYSDVQSPATILIVIGETRRNALNMDLQLQEHIMMSYMELLSRFKLYNLMTQIRNLSWIPSIRAMNQQSTSYRITCSTCNKTLPISKWICDQCGGKICAYCHLVVRGLFTWCQVCGHGGHMQHMIKWFTTHSECPISGCGHKCNLGRGSSG